ncbi:PREDICTED: uncharacterized protein LOC106817025 [Priapulus caudatus]|uniref:Uncharacterized protein LOC106817025 n=1 Tax=Priapulus caudatus TaxID=37621 RepID=A0ABM1EY90_PRICU|nr:PREDICTED: uncharacterized protein LOC106817025 [Priapulus caudatus]
MEIESVRSRRSNAVSTTSSQAARARAKAEAAKVRMEFIHRESELKLKKVTLENEGEMLNAQKEIAVAEAEAEALDPDYTNSLKEGSQSNLSLLPKDESKERTTDYVNKLQTGGTMLDPRVEPYVPVAATPGGEYERMAIATELTRLLLKKDLLFSSLTNFNGNPELYRTWKSSFHSKMRELDVTSVEEIDLLVKWTSNEVQKDVLSLKAANADDPGKGLRQIWERLGERYGSPEMVEASLKRRLESFPRLTNKEPKRLYELSDIVSEIEAIKENEGFKGLLAYFDSSSGVTPIVNKLPYNLQEKWTSSATRYMDRYHVVYPPFSHFSAFLREQSKIRNNPSFAYNVKQATVSLRTSHRDAHYISARKTGLVTDTTEKQSDEPCPLHNTNHSFKTSARNSE